MKFPKKPDIDVLYKLMPNGELIAIERDWTKIFALVPHKTITGKWVWLKTLYRRRVLFYTGFHNEPETQYGTLFDILAST